jgi:hypothetical protein
MVHAEDMSTSHVAQDTSSISGGERFDQRARLADLVSTNTAQAVNDSTELSG